MVLSIKPWRDAAGLANEQLLIDGAWGPAADERTWSHTHPATGEQVADFAVADAADVDRAVRAARRAFDEGPWPRSRAKERIRVLRRTADLVREHSDELLRLVALDNSVPLTFGSVYAMSTECVADVFDHHAGWVDKLAGETLPAFQGGDHLTMTLREPVGVVAAVIPWNGRCCSPRRRSHPRSPPAARWCSSRRSTRRCPHWPWPNSPSERACRPASSTS